MREVGYRMKLLKKYKEKVTNTKGLTFELNFKPISKRLAVCCLNAPGLSFRWPVEEVMGSFKTEEVDDFITGIVYKCNSYKEFKEIAENIRKN